MQLLIIEDDPKISAFISKGFRQAGFVVTVALDGELGLEKVLQATYDAAIVDLMLPKRDGLNVITELRAQGRQLPVLILSAKRSIDDRILGLQKGGDDYLTKPFSFAELLARVQALIRRASRVPETTRLIVGDLTLDLLSRQVEREGRPIDLQSREFTLLEYLMRHAGQVVSKTMILEHVWDYDFDPQTNVVDVLACRLRNKVDRDFPTKLIQTLRGAGYVIKAP